MGRVAWFFVLLAMIAAVANADVAHARESVLDRKVHIEEGLVLDVPQLPPLCDSIRGLKKAKIDIGDCKLYCEREGKGMPIVLVNGGPGCSHQIFHPEFSEAAKFARVIYYDQRGVGQSDYDASGKTYTVRQAVEDLESLRKALKIEKWIVVGHSYGGFLAQCYALEHPESLVGLVLICALPGTPNVPLGSRQDDYITTKEIAKFDSISADGTLSKEQEIYNGLRNGGWKHQNFYRPTDDEIARIARYEWKPAPGFRERIWSDEARIDLENKFDSFDIPTLIVEAKWDLTWTSDKPGKMLKNHPRAKVVLFKHSGHSPYSDEPKVFFPLLRDFIKSAEAAPVPAADRMGTRIPWVPAVAYKIDEMPWTGEDQKPLNLLAEARTAHLADASAWFKLGLVLYDSKHYPEALEAFGQVTPLHKCQAIVRFASYSWQGQVLDLMGRRDDALKTYQQALKIDIGSNNYMRHDQYNMTIDRKWVEERLKTPFVRE